MVGKSKKFTPWEVSQTGHPIQDPGGRRGTEGKDKERPQPDFKKTSGAEQQRMLGQLNGPGRAEISPQLEESGPWMKERKGEVMLYL